jgi:hypothetical protein
MCNPSAVPGGLLFKHTRTGKSYISLHYHRDPKRAAKSRWHEDFKPQDEFNLFDQADHGEWQCDKGDYWAVAGDQIRALGSRGEILAKFPRTSNADDPWHGYPFEPRAVDFTIPSAVVARWQEAKVISRIVAKRIRGYIT